MNWLLIIVLGIIVCSMLEGYRQGLMRMVFSTVILVVVLVAGYLVTPYMKTALQEHTGFDEKIAQGCREYLQQQAEDRIGNATSGLTEGIAESGWEIPEEWMESLTIYGSETADNWLEESGVYDSLADSAADLIMKGVAYLLSVLLIYAISFLLMRVLDLLTKLPGIKGANKIAGLLLGAVKGILMVWMLFYLISLFCASAVGTHLLQYISESSILTWLYQHNVLLWFL